MRVAHAERADSPPPAGCLHQLLDAGERVMMTQQRGKARKGADFSTAKPSQPLLCVALSASHFCRLRQIGLSGQGE